MHPRILRLTRIAATLAVLMALAAAGAAELARVEQALDGDSLRLADGRELRMIGINAPEFGRQGAPDETLAAAARDRVAALVEQRRVRLRYGPERHDRYGRTLAYVELPDGRDLQEILLSEGLAWFVAVAPNVAHVNDYRVTEAEARGRRRGVWGREEYRPVPAEALTSEHTGFRRVSGTVRAVRRRGERLELRLAPRVWLIVPRSIGGALEPPVLGKQVLARGWLAEYKNSLRMRITHPSMLELTS